MERIVVGVDGSENSRRALEWAVAEAQLRRASLEVVNAWQPPLIVGFGVMPGGAAVAEGQAYEEEAHRVLDEMTAGVHPADPSLRIEKLAVRGSGALALLEVAKGAELIVVGSRGRGGFAGLLLGSVSQQVAQHAGMPGRDRAFAVTPEIAWFDDLGVDDAATVGGLVSSEVRFDDHLAVAGSCWSS